MEKLIPDEGYIKFGLHWEESPFGMKEPEFSYLNTYREKLYKLGLIGVYNNGIGFGNLSIRHNQNEFIISGSATGCIPTLEQRHYALVTNFNIAKNQVWCQGLTKASSESMSHAAIYQSNSSVNAVIHIHHRELWEKLMYVLPTTNIKAEFGTPEIAIEIARLSKTDSGIIIMGGHPEGIIIYGKKFEEAFNILIKQYKEL